MLPPQGGRTEKLKKKLTKNFKFAVFRLRRSITNHIPLRQITSPLCELPPTFGNLLGVHNGTQPFIPALVSLLR